MGAGASGGVVMDAPLGIEPRLPQSKCGVLPLDEGAMAKAAGFEPAITVLETVALGQTKLRRHWPSRLDLNQRPQGSEPRALSGCATGRWSRWKVSNLRSPDPKSGALPTKLHLETRCSRTTQLHRRQLGAMLGRGWR